MHPTWPSEVLCAMLRQSVRDPFLFLPPSPSGWKSRFVPIFAARSDETTSRSVVRRVICWTGSSRVICQGIAKLLAFCFVIAFYCCTKTASYFFWSRGCVSCDRSLQTLQFHQQNNNLRFLQWKTNILVDNPLTSTQNLLLVYHARHRLKLSLLNGRFLRCIAGAASLVKLRTTSWVPIKAEGY